MPGHVGIDGEEGVLQALGATQHCGMLSCYLLLRALGCRDLHSSPWLAHSVTEPLSLAEPSWLPLV